MAEWREEQTEDGRKIHRMDLGEIDRSVYLPPGALEAAVAKDSQNGWVVIVRYRQGADSLQQGKEKAVSVARRLAGLPPKWAR